MPKNLSRLLRRPYVLGLLALSLYALGAPGSTAATAATPPGDPTVAALAQERPASLERLLRRARAEERALLARLREPVQIAVQGLERAARGRALERAKAELLDLGPEAAPLLIPYLATVENPTPAQLRRAEAIAEALRSWGAPGGTEALIALALDPESNARPRAISVLPRVSDQERARAVLAEILAGNTPAARPQAARGLLELLERGDQASLPPLRGLLFEEDLELVSVGLRALTLSRDNSTESHVRGIARQPSKALAVLPELRAYGEILPENARAALALALVQGAAQGDLDTPQVRSLLNLAARLEPDLNRDLAAAFEPLLEATDPALQDEARICLALLGDRSARRTLMRKYDEWVKLRSNLPTVYEDRAEIELRLKQYDDAAKDCQTGIDLRRAREMEVPRERYIELARARCLDGKLRQASKALGQAYLSARQLSTLRADPDFEALVKHSRYGKIFRE